MDVRPDTQAAYKGYNKLNLNKKGCSVIRVIQTPFWIPLYTIKLIKQLPFQGYPIYLEEQTDERYKHTCPR